MLNLGFTVRVRPPNSWEAQRLPEPVLDTGFRGEGAFSAPGRPVTQPGCLREVVKIVDDRILMFDPDEKDRTRAFMERGFVPPGTRRYKDKRFMFDRVFDRETRQVDVYEATARPLLDGLLDGYNATVFAYGVRDLISFMVFSSNTVLRQRGVERHIRSAGLIPIQALFT